MNLPALGQTSLAKLVADMNDTCRICGEPQSAHVPTERGPLTHPREARGEGVYIYVATMHYGAGCCECGYGCEGHEIYRFQPTETCPSPQLQEN